jgi:hypothetical protein
MEKPKGITIPAPAGFTPPEGVAEGDTFDAVATVTMTGGSLVLTELDGIPVAAASAEGDDMEEMEEMGGEDFESAIERGMV